MRSMRTSALVICAVVFLGTSNAPPLVAAGDPDWNRDKPAVPGLVPSHATVHGFTLKEVATAWNNWAFGTPASVNPIVAVRCERSPLDVRIFFLPVSLGGEFTNTCYVPQGSFLA